MNNSGPNFSNISEKSVYTNTEINKKLKENEDTEYAKLQNRKYIYFNNICCNYIELDEMVNYINNMKIK